MGRGGFIAGAPVDVAAAEAAREAEAAALEAEGMSKQDIRRLQRKKREEEWSAFNATKPDEQYENPDDVAAISEVRVRAELFASALTQRAVRTPPLERSTRGDQISASSRTDA